MGSNFQFEILGATFTSPLRVAYELPFSEQDLLRHPWLASDVRYYGIEGTLGRDGGKAKTFRGYVSDKDNNRVSGTPDLVIKLPNINESLFTAEGISEWCSAQIEDNLREWDLTRARLRDCPHANLIFDISETPRFYRQRQIRLPVSFQVLLADFVPLDDYLLHKKFRQAPYTLSVTPNYRERVDNWRGMDNWKEFLSLALPIATALNEIHKRRVVHGDIWPPNIFVQERSGLPFIKFIDFGEAFPFTPLGEPQTQRNHAYRAPERESDAFSVNEQSDVYSFGKVLFYLASGHDPIVPKDLDGLHRRIYISEQIRSRNRAIAVENPWVIDLICSCLSIDPVLRPKMQEICTSLRTYVNLEARPIEATLDRDLYGLMTSLEAKLATIGPALKSQIALKLQELTWLIEGLDTEMVDLVDTRERLIQSLVSVFGHLGEGDKYISLTSPGLWQGGALGLNGRYTTATLMALRRRASVQRTFAFSVESLGTAWTRRLAGLLEEAGLDSLAERLKLTADLVSRNDADTDLTKLNISLVEHRDQLLLVLESFAKMSELGGFSVHDGQFTQSGDCSGLFLGLLPLPSENDVNRLKSKHFASAFYFANESELHDRYLLMVTDCRGRGSKGRGASLRGVRFYKSVLGTPQDRVMALEDVFRQAIPISNDIRKICDSIRRMASPVNGIAGATDSNMASHTSSL